MPSYLIEGYLPRSHASELSAAVGRLRGAAEALTAEGVPVRHVRSSFLPADELVLHVLEAESAEAAGDATRRAGISPERMTTEEVAPCPPARHDDPSGSRASAIPKGGWT